MKMSQHLLLLSLVIFISLAVAIAAGGRKEGPMEQPAKQQSGAEVVNEKTFVKLWWVSLLIMLAESSKCTHPSYHITPDYDPHRVRVFVDYHGAVSLVPVIG